MTLHSLAGDEVTDVDHVTELADVARRLDTAEEILVSS
jgi:hypothetical protein